MYLETFGCAMNVSDSEIVLSVLAAAGYERRTDSLEDADVILTNTCAIREAAEAKVWSRLGALMALKKARIREGDPRPLPVVGVLGCMAERLKGQLLESGRLVDIVCGPDAYRDLPRMIDAVRSRSAAHAINTQLSIDETYGDIVPVRSAANRVSAYVSIMRGCANMCSFCVVPFTRGQERSRDVGSIVDEVVSLAEQGYREVTLLGQNVNSFHDDATPASGVYAALGYTPSAGFGNMNRAREAGSGVRFTELLDRVSAAAPSLRLRFTSPHPKDFPDDLLHLMAERPGICKQVHLPAQSGSTAVLTAMRRHYSREAYLRLADRIRTVVPGVALSTDIISGFCGETAADHADTLSLMEAVRFENAYMFAYSKRERTHAAYKLVDDVPPDVKLARLQEVIAVFRAGAAAAHAADVGSVAGVLIDGPAKRSTAAAPLWAGRTDSGKRVIVASHTALAPGALLDVRIVAAGVTSLQGVPVAAAAVPPVLLEGGSRLPAAR